MDVDPGEVHRATRSGPVELRRRRRARVGPGRLVPTEAEDDGVGARAYVGRQRLEHLLPTGGFGQVEPGEAEPGLGQMDVRVDERGRHQPAAEVDDLVGPVGVRCEADVRTDARSASRRRHTSRSLRSRTRPR